MLGAISIVTSCASNANNDTITEQSNDKIIYEYTGTNSTGSTLRELYVIKANNTENKKLTFTDDGFVKTLVGLSHDGFAVYKYGKDFSLYSVPLSNPSSATTKKIASDQTMEITPLAITSDNRVLYYIGWNLYSVKADGSEAPKALNPASASNYVGVTTNNFVVYWDDNGLYAVDPAKSRPSITLSATRPISEVQIFGTLVVYSNSGIYKVDTATTNTYPVLLINEVPYQLLAVKNGYVFYTKLTQNGNHKLWKINIDGTGSLQLTTSTDGDDDFIAFTSDNRVIYKKRNSTNNDLYSVAITGGSETPLAANPLKDDDYLGVADGNRIIIQTAIDPLYWTIISVKSDGTGLITLASGTSGNNAGGYARLVTPDGWVIYEKGTNSITMTSVKADNTAHGTFTNVQGKMGATSANRVVATMFEGSALRLFTVKSDGTGPQALNTEYTNGVDSLVLVSP
jgi:hypothetical protein